MDGFLWWQTGLVYQVYPRSFADASGDGVGDLRGVTGKLGYLERLGVDAVWLSPIFPSPMADFGYDVSDYTGIHPLFGTMEDFDELLAEAHGRGIKVLLDFVPNHTSDEHPWFAESRSSRENPKRDWYVWRDGGPSGSLPNNWDSAFGGPAWEWDETAGQYYLSTFHRKQVDLNWRNPDVREAMYGAMRFWFKKGVDGFRIDVLWLLIKDDLFRDNPSNPEWVEGDMPFTRKLRTYSEDRPEVQEIVREMRAVADEYDERVLVGEIYLPLERFLAYYGERRDENLDGIHLPFNFQLVTMKGWDAASVKDLVDGYEAALPEGAWPNWVLGNHDMPRIAGRVGDAQARVAQMLLLTLRGTPTLYYGDEIGMPNADIPEHLIVDPQGKGSPGYGRDGARTPMRWNTTPNAGFCPENVQPWLPLGNNLDSINVAAEDKDPRSMLNLTRSLIALRRETPALTAGSYQPLATADNGVYVFAREHEGQRVIVALNFTAEARRKDLFAAGETGEVLCSTHMDRTDRAALSRLELRPDEGVVILAG